MLADGRLPVPDYGEGMAESGFPVNSRKSQDRASRQSRMTVSGETFNTTAVSSTLRPPKNRSSIT
jgi:hypothetical protein